MRVGRIFLCQPRHHLGLPHSHRVFWTCSSKRYGDRLTQSDLGSSLLAFGFNSLWCHALNLQMDGEDITHFAMLHDDIVPESGWVDILIDDIDKYDADLVSAVVPIKEMTGATSTAIDDPTNPYQVERRITMDEIYRLPEVFTAADCGYPDRSLLTNTGCWVCRFDRDWRFKVYFTIRDRVIRNEKNHFVPQVDPEDWFFSRMIQELGGKVMASRRVALDHHGSLPYSNRQPWGHWDHDRNLGYKFGHLPIKHDGPLRDDFKQPKLSKEMPDVEGWLSDDEGQALSRLAEGKTVLEIGSYCGRSTIWMAKTAICVHAVDPFTGLNVGGRDTLELFKSNIERYHVNDKVVIHKGMSDDKVPRIPNVDLAFIDGAHDYESVLNDTRLAASILNPGGLLVYHDYKSHDGPTQVVDSMVEKGAQLVETVGSLAMVCVSNKVEQHGFIGAA